MSRPRRIALVLESRSTYGYCRPIIEAIDRRPELVLQTLVTGMHLVPELGLTIDEIKRDGVPISATAETGAPDEDAASWSRALGRGVASAADALAQLDPDIVLLFGDRMETFSVALAGVYMDLPLAHVQAGDKSGHVDDRVRMAMAKLVHLHFAPNQEAADRLNRLGEQPFRIHTVGAPQLDLIVGRDFSAERLEIAGRTHDLTRPYILLVQHPLMSGYKTAADELRLSVEAALETGLPVFCIYPNSDLGFRAVVSELERLQRRSVIAAPNLKRDDFLTLMANASVLMGNSSAGILEAPSLGVPVVNLGERQRGRLQAGNILNAPFAPAAIREALTKALYDESFRATCRTVVNPHGDGLSAPRIVDLLSTVVLDDALRDKVTVY